MRINKIRIQNFKVFKDITIDFNSSDLIVFDGPNGFGKTTIYDAIELGITGRIRRYNELKSKLIDGRQTFSENPFYNIGAESGDIILTLEIQKNDQIHVLERFVQEANIDSYIDFSIYKLFIKSDFFSTERTSVDDEKSFLSELLGENYQSNFQFLNYVEQEDSLFLLKHSDKERKGHIRHLFDLKEFEIKVKRIDDLKKKIDSVYEKNKMEADELELKIKALSQSLVNEETPSNYLRLFRQKDYAWDNEDLDFSQFSYNELVGAEGEFERLKVLIERKKLFKQYRKNRAVDSILENEQLIRDFLVYYNFLSRKEEFKEARDKILNLQEITKILESLTGNNLEQVIDLQSYEFIPIELKELFGRAKQELFLGFQELLGLDKIYSDISRSRSELLGELNALREEGITPGDCILCGYNWGSIEELILNIENKSEQIAKINSDKSIRLQESLEHFKAEIVKELIRLIKENISTYSYNNEFVSRLIELEQHHFNDFVRNLQFLKINYVEYLKEEQTNDHSEIFEKFKIEIKALRNDIEAELIESFFQNTFQEYFNNEFDLLDLFQIENLETKRKYLSHKWSLNQNQLFKENSIKLIDSTKRRDDAKLIGKQLKDLKGTYDASLKSFQKKVIKDIETIFHIYSGRIMQFFHGGIGLFIFSEKDGIRFQTDSTKTYDAIFTMSSGQLSALIISFTLALHKKYSHNKLILIDDPVQTMDELNLYGFIDLLRNEFGDNQIILSTHEDMMSAFMRYKFKNYNLSEKGINLKNISQAN